MKQVAMQPCQDCLAVFQQELLEAIPLIEVCGNLEMQMIRASAEGRAEVCESHIQDVTEVLEELDRVLLPIGFQTIAKKIRENVEEYVRFAKLRFLRKRRPRV